MSSKIKVDTIENVAGSGNVSLGSGHNLVVPGNITGQGTAAITSNATVGGTLGVTGASTLTGNTTVGGTLKVNTIQNAAGSNTISDGSPSIDLWRLSANFSSNATITGWERPDETSATNASYVNGLTESSGVFTFPSTGYYLIQLCAQVEAASNADGTIGVQISTSVDGGSNFTLAAFSSSGDTDTGNSNGSNTQIIFKVTDTTQARIRFDASSLSAGTFVHGSSTFNLTNFSSVKVAPIQ